MSFAAWLEWGEAWPQDQAVPTRRERWGTGNASTPGTHLDRNPRALPSPGKVPQTLELNSPNFLGHLNIQEPLQVTVT